MDSSFDWGVETSMNEGQQFIDDLLFDETVTGKADEVKPNDKKDDKTETPKGKKKEESEDKSKSEAKSKSDNKDDEDEDKPESILDLFDDSEDEDDQEETTTPTDEDDQSDDEDDNDNDQDQSDDDEDEEEVNTYAALSQDLVKLGIFLEDEENEQLPETGEQLKERFELESRKRAQFALDQYLGRFGDDRKQLFDAVFNKGVDLNEYLSAFQRVEKFAELDLEKPGNQERVVRKSLEFQGWEPEDIDEEVERLKEYGDLGRASQRYHKALVKNEAAQLEKQELEAEQKLQLKQQSELQYQQAVQGILNEKLKQKDFDGIPVTPAVANSVYNKITAKNWRLPSGEEITDFDKFILDLQRPENFPLKVKIALLWNNDFDLTKVANKLKSKESTQIFDSVATKHKSSKKKSKKKKKGSSDDDLFSTVWGTK